MSTDIKQEDLQQASASEVDTATAQAEANQDPLKAELEKVQQKKSGKTELEQALYKRNQIDLQIKKLKDDIGSDEEPEKDDDDAPVTVGMLKKIQQQTATKTALQLADEIPSETERELTKYHIQNSIRSTGNPSEDLNLARAIVNSAKNSQIAEELARKSKAKSFSSSSSADAKIGSDVEVEFSKEELQFMKPPFNMTKADIIKARG